LDAATGDLLLRDLAGGGARRLTANRNKGEFAYFSTLSRDGRLAAYAWFNGERFYELRLVRTDGGPERVLYRNEESGFVQPCAFSPDGKQILTLLFRRDNISQIALISTESGAATIVKSLNWVYPKRMDFSPDGRSIVYDNFAQDGVSQRDIFLLSLDARSERRVVESPADDLFPVFSADGKHVYFSSDRGGAPELWSVGMEDGKVERTATGLGRFLLLGLSGADSLLYATRKGGEHVYRAGIDLRRGKLTTRPEQIGEGSAAVWSPDGGSIAWLARRNSENFGRDAVFVGLYDTASGKVTTVTPRLAHIERLAWSGKGELLASGSDGKGRGGVFRIALDSSAAAPVAREPGAPHTGFPADGPYIARINRIFRDATIVAESQSRVTALAASLDGASVAFADGNTIRVAGQQTAAIPAGRATDAVRFTPDGTALVTVHSDEIWLRPLDGGQPVRIARAATAIDSISFDPGGKWLLFSAGRPVSEVWSLSIGTP
jgi:Tol biopolymer transport system component